MLNHQNRVTKRDYECNKLEKYFLNKGIINEYNLYTRDIAKLMDEIINFDNPIYYAIMLKLLTDKGVFSYNNILQYNQDIDDILFGYWGVNVLGGEVCCRGSSAFQYDVFSNGNLPNKLFFCHITKDELKKSEIKLNVGNHVINLILYDNNLYGYDSVRNKLFTFIDVGAMRMLYSNNPLYLYYDKYLEIIFQGTKERNTNRFVEYCTRYIDRETISNSDFQLLNYMAKDAIASNRTLVDDFRYESKKRVKRIIDGIR